MLKIRFDPAAVESSQIRKYTAEIHILLNILNCPNSIEVHIYIYIANNQRVSNKTNTQHVEKRVILISHPPVLNYLSRLDAILL